VDLELELDDGTVRVGACRPPGQRAHVRAEQSGPPPEPTDRDQRRGDRGAESAPGGRPRGGDELVEQVVARVYGRSPDVAEVGFVLSSQYSRT
jgi:hypothetical protein